MFAVFRQELAGAGNGSIAELTRFHLHLDANEPESFSQRLRDLINQFLAGAPRNDAPR